MLFILVASCTKKEETPHITTDQYLNLVRSKFTGEQAYTTTAFVEKYWRVVGNQGFNKSIHHIANELEAAGFIQETNASEQDQFVYRIEKRPLKHPTWEPIDAMIQIAGEEDPLLPVSYTHLTLPTIYSV